jgi:hypothetical protein
VLNIGHYKKFLLSEKMLDLFKAKTMLSALAPVSGIPVES